MVQKLEKILSFYGYSRDNMDIKKCKTLGEFHQEARRQGYLVPAPMYYGIQIAMKELNMSFAEVFELFVKNRIIIQEEGFFIYDMRGHNSFLDDMRGHKGLDDISTK